MFHVWFKISQDVLTILKKEKKKQGSMKVTRLPRSHKLLEKDTLGLRTDKMAQHTKPSLKHMVVKRTDS